MRELANGVTTNKTVRRVHRRPIRRGGPHSMDARTSSLAAYFLCVLRKLSHDAGRLHALIGGLNSISVVAPPTSVGTN